MDDDPYLLASMRRGFKPHAKDWTVRFAASGAEALELYSLSPADVVVTDLSMPMMDGLELVEALNDQKQGPLHTILLTGRGSFEAAVEALNSGHIQRFLTKPCSLATLAETIEAVRPCALPQAAANDHTSEAVLARLRPAVMLVDAAGTVNEINPRASTLLAGFEALKLDAHNRIRAFCPAETKKLHQAFEEAAQGAEGQVWHFPILDPVSGMRRNLAISSLKSKENKALAMVVISNPDDTLVPSADALCDYLGLSRAEARLAHTLATCGEFEVAAELAGLTPSSARTYLKRIYQKTEVHSQGELMRLVFSLPVRFLNVG